MTLDARRGTLEAILLSESCFSGLKDLHGFSMLRTTLKLAESL